MSQDQDPEKKGRIVPFTPAGPSSDYARFLSDLMLPSVDEFAEWVSLDEIFQVGMIIWNLGLVQKYQPEAYQEMETALLQDLAPLGIGEKTLRRLVRNRVQTYGSHEELIAQVEVDEQDDDLSLAVETLRIANIREGLEQGTLDFRQMFQFGENAGYGEEDEEGSDEDDLEEDLYEDDRLAGYVERIALVVTPKPAFGEWIAAQLDPGTLETLLRPSVFLISVLDREQDLSSLFRIHGEKILANYLVLIKKGIGPRKITGINFRIGLISIARILFLTWRICHCTKTGT